MLVNALTPPELMASIYIPPLQDLMAAGKPA